MRIAVSVMLVVLCAANEPASASPLIPDTPAGHALAAWLDAFNSGDRARVEAYHKKWEPKGSVDRTLAFRRRTGGLELVAVDHSAPLVLSFRAHEKAGPVTEIGRIAVKSADPPVIVAFDIGPMPPGMTAADMEVKVDAALRARVLEAIAAKLTELYVFPDTARKMVDALRARQKKGEYDAIDDGYQLSGLLTEHLQAASHDGHLRVDCVPNVLPKEEHDLDLDREPPVDDQMRARMERDNCGFEKAERLEGNIGYLRFDFFGRPTVCSPTASAAMNFLAHVDALIVDLRQNGGGDPRGVAWISSYLFDERTHLNDIYQRKRNKTTEYWTQPDVPGTKLGGAKPVYVLTSSRTFSGGEEFAYNLKALKRATIVGETTGGGAHPQMGRRLDDHFRMAVPFARAINPITKTDWEGTGVEPDVKVPADQALDVAKKLAADAIRNSAPPPRTQ